MGELTRSRLKLVAMLSVAAVLIMLPRWFGTGGEIQEPAKRKAMPRFSWPTLTGENWSIEEQKGRIVLVNFWATWCGPCREETPDLVRVYERYGSKGVEIAGASLDDDPVKQVPAFLKEFNVRYPILVPPEESPLVIAIQNLPTSFLVDRSGKIARSWVGAVRERDLTSAIDKLLEESGQ